MKAAILKEFESPLAIETMPDPTLGTGEVIVDVVATRVLSYANEVFSGERQYLLELPVVPGPGAIGRVRAIGPDATHLAIGDWVLRSDRALARRCAKPRHHAARLERARRRRPAPAEAFPPRLMGRTDAGPDRERQTDRRDR
jgi:NADPH:quinone reductase-like Zn-dependent oxidoreductase